MATYYVRTTGSDVAAGTSPATAWATLGKALGAAGIASGDTLYVGPGTYRELVNVQMTSATAETPVIADVTGQHTGDAPGPVILTAFTTDDDTAASGTNSLIRLQGRDYLHFQRFWFYGGTKTEGIVDATVAGSTNISFSDCYFAGPGNRSRMGTYQGTAGAAATWRLTRCIFRVVGATGWLFTLPLHSADYDVDILFQNCELFGWGGSGTLGISVSGSGGAGSFGGGGVRFYNGTLLWSGGVAFNASGTLALDAAKACAVRNSYVSSGVSAGFSATNAGSLLEDYNYYNSGVARSNVTTGPNSLADNSRMMDFEVGQSALIGLPPRPTGVPTAGSRLLGRGSDAAVSLATDLLNRQRPAGGASASKGWGALERHDTAIAPGTTVGAESGTGYIELVGVGDHDFDLPVDATATTVTIKTKTSGYSGTNYPQMKIVNGGECGVPDASVDATSASASAYESLSIGPFTPTAKGIVTVRLTNRSANGTGIAAFDAFGVS